MLLQRLFFSGLSVKQINNGLGSKTQRGKVTEHSPNPKEEKSVLPFKAQETLFILPPLTAAVSAEKCTSDVK